MTKVILKDSMAGEYLATKGVQSEDGYLFEKGEIISLPNPQWGGEEVIWSRFSLGHKGVNMILLQEIMEQDATSCEISRIESEIEGLIKQKATLEKQKSCRAEEILFLQISPPEGWSWKERRITEFSPESSDGFRAAGPVETLQKECVLYQEGGREIDFRLFKALERAGKLKSIGLEELGEMI